jgi:DNA-binding NtrC family response regulator
VTAKSKSIEALREFADDPQQYDLVITDQTMPQMTGIELAKELLTIRPDLPVVLCTGFSQEMSPEDAKAMGIREFLMKPYGLRELSLVIKSALADSANEDS